MSTPYHQTATPAGAIRPRPLAINIATAYVSPMQSVADYFELSNSQDLAWHHGVHTESALAAACEQPIHVAVTGVRFAETDATPMATSGLKKEAGLDLATVLIALNAANKAIKLDILESAAAEPTLQLLARIKPEVPVILHANVFALLSANSADGLAPEAFFALCHTYAPKALISLGWSLKRAHDADGRLEEGLIEQLADMTRHHLPAANYAIEIRAGYTSGVERGAAFIFDPLPPAPPANGKFADGTNVVDATSRFRNRSAA